MDRITLTHSNMRVSLLSYGATTQGWWLGDTPLILGYDDPDAYLTDPNFHGAIVGRLANRVRNASFELNGTKYMLAANEGTNQLHGGPEGLWAQDWTIQETTTSSAHLSYLSPDGEGGYPGQVKVDLVVRLDGNSLTYGLQARPDRPTPISLTQHNYYCLGDPSLPQDPVFQIEADKTLDLGPGQIPTGALHPVDGTTLDFRTPTPLAKAAGGIDHFYVFAPDRPSDQPFATLTAKSGLTLRAYTDQPGAQVYTGQGLSAGFIPRTGTCIEPSGYPNAVNIPDFPSVIFTPDRPYRQILRLEIEAPEQ